MREQLLTPDEKHMLLTYRRLTPDDRHTIQDITELLGRLPPKDQETINRYVEMARRGAVAASRLGQQA